jgi:DNA adenine methylase
MKPLCKWSGGKRTEIKLFEHLFPTEYKTYIEPFMGGGAVYFHLAFEGKNVINDIHPDLVNFYRMVSDGHSTEIYNIVSTWGITEDDFYYYRGTGKRCAKGICFTPQNDIEKAAQFIYLRRTCFRGMMRYNSHGEFNIPWGRYKTADFTDLTNPKYQGLLERTEVNFGDYKKIFEKYNSSDNFMFLDPPYDSEFSDYGFDDFNQQSQIELSELFKATKNKCMIVISETPLIRELYSDYIKHIYPKKYAFKIYGGRVGDEIDKNHLVITNY